MTPTIIQSTSLYYRAGRSDKGYQAAIEEVPGEDDAFLVTFAYGRRGSTLQTGTKTPQPVSREAAIKIHDKLVASKWAKGYRISGGGPGTPYRQAVVGLPCDVLLDGEAVGDILHVFDLLERDGDDLRPHRYIERHSCLLRLAAPPTPSSSSEPPCDPAWKTNTKQNQAPISSTRSSGTPREKQILARINQSDRYPTASPTPTYLTKPKK